MAGSDGSGDPFFPLAGNGGYDVKHYGLNVDYEHESDALEGLTVIRARATQNLYRFNLDLRDTLAVSRVTVDFRRADFRQELGQELVIWPKKKLQEGRALPGHGRVRGRGRADRRPGRVDRGLDPDG